MSFFKIIDTLYNGSCLDDILTIINQAVYAEEFDKSIDKNKPIVLHTGFIFKTPLNEFELLYHCESKTLIKQTKSWSLNPLLGLICCRTGDNKFYNEFVPTQIATGIYENDMPMLSKLIDFEIYNLSKPIKKIKVVDSYNEIIEFDTFIIDNDHNAIKEFPLNRDLGTLLFFNKDSRLFERYIYIDEDKFNESHKEGYKYWIGPIEEMFQTSLINIGINYRTRLLRNDKYWLYSCKSYKGILKDKDNIGHEEYKSYIEVAGCVSCYTFNGYSIILEYSGCGKTVDECLENTNLKYKENIANELKELKRTEYHIDLSARLENYDWKEETFYAMTDGQLGSWDDFDGDIDDVFIWAGRE